MNAAFALTSAATVYHGLLNGPLGGLMGLLTKPMFMTNSSDDTTTSNPPTGGGQCGPGGPGDDGWWEKVKEKFRKTLAPVMTAWGLWEGDPGTHDLGDIANDPRGTISAGKKWNEELRKEFDLSDDNPNNRKKDDDC